MAAWYKTTNDVIPDCGEDLFTASYERQTKCILGRVVDRSEIKGFVDSCWDQYSFLLYYR